MKNFIRQYRNARTAITQIKNGEWRPVYNPITEAHLDAQRGNLELWIGNGPWFCEIKNNAPYFGLIWRHYVWWKAARQLKRNADASRGHNNQVPLL